MASNCLISVSLAEYRVSIFFCEKPYELIIEYGKSIPSMKLVIDLTLKELLKFSTSLDELAVFVKILI
jgi:hypothetical protein